MGVLFTEFDGITKEKLSDKIMACIAQVLTPEQVAQISVECHLFPEETTGDGQKAVEKNAIMYTEPENNSLAKQTALFCKRSIDIFASLCSVILFAPVFIIVPVLIKLTSDGPVFFKQERVGRCGKKFKLIKFRTMYTNNNQNEHKEFIRGFIKGTRTTGAGAQPEFKMKNDPRITPIGRILRKSSIDEIPQFFNVLRGDMSMVGPRPAIPYEVEEYDIWHRRRVVEIKPGITGIWQVNGRSRTDFNNMVRMDIQYIEKWSPLMDLRLMLQTPLALLTAKGAY
jgi:exopolysaccharide biosynthesis polyprenyl glycosylphosphotransferase